MPFRVPGGRTPPCAFARRLRGREKTALWYRSVFGEEKFYIEIQDHGIPEQTRILPDLLRLSKETGIPLVATNDAHYLTKEDSRIQNVLLCIQLNKTVGEETGMGFETDEFYLKSEEEMRALFPQVSEAIDNTEKSPSGATTTLSSATPSFLISKRPTVRTITPILRNSVLRG